MTFKLSNTADFILDEIALKSIQVLVHQVSRPVFLPLPEFPTVRDALRYQNLLPLSICLPLLAFLALVLASTNVLLLHFETGLLHDEVLEKIMQDPLLFLFLLLNY